MKPLSELQRFPNGASAYLVKSRLAQEDIAAQVRRGSRYQAMGGSGWIVQVASEDLERARAILDELDSPVDMDEYVDENSTGWRRCPQCRSVMVVREPLAGRPRLLALITLGASVPFTSKHFRCSKCGHSWDGR